MSMKTAEDWKFKCPEQYLPIGRGIPNPTKHWIEQIQSDAYQAGVEANKAVPIKTIQETAKGIVKLLRFYSVYPNAEERQLMCIEEQIGNVINSNFQSGKKEGWKEGMLEASVIAKNKISVVNPKIQGYVRVAFDVNQAILTAIENKDK